MNIPVLINLNWNTYLEITSNKYNANVLEVLLLWSLNIPTP